MSTRPIDAGAIGTVALTPAPGVGDAAPDFELPDPSGARHRLAELRGSPVVLAFQPTHWDPAWAEYVRAYNRLVGDVAGDAGARLVSVVGAGTWHSLTFDDTTVELPVMCVDAGPVARCHGVAGGPAVFVIDPAGRVSWRHTASDAPPSPNDVALALAALAPDSVETEQRTGWNRRQFVATMLAATLALAFTRRLARAEARPTAAPPENIPLGSAANPVTLHVNGRDLSLDLEPRVTLLDALREYAGITGPKKGCDHGQCGACTVHVNGRRILSCLTFAVMQQGKDITTIEGLAATAGAVGDALHPMQQAFIDHDGFQCGYCTSGQVMSAAAMVREPWGPTDDDVREAMSGNICRCGAYPGIVAAIQEVRKKNAATDQGGRR
jgi:xanthine dehydrogenase YagT iron-sulfur-binding subunit